MTLEVDMGEWIDLWRELMSNEGVRLSANSCRSMVRTAITAFCRQYSDYITARDETDVEYCVRRFYESGLIERPSRYNRGEQRPVIEQSILEDTLEQFLDRIYKDVSTTGSVSLPYEGIINPRFTAREWVSIAFIDKITLDEIRFDLEKCNRPTSFHQRAGGEGFTEFLAAFNVIESMYRFKSWLEEHDQERLKPITNEIYELVDRFIDNAGWM